MHGMTAFRIGLPGALVVAGAVLIIIGHANTGASSTALGVVLIGVALIVLLLGWLARLASSSNRDREREQAAREEFTRTGRWPDE